MKVTDKNQLHKGQWVEVLLQVTPTITKRKRAKVLDVVRKAATLEFEDGRVKVVRFSEIEIEEPKREETEVKTAPLKASIGERVQLTPVKQPAALPAPRRTDAEVKREIENETVIQAAHPGLAPRPIPANDDFSQWLAMGKELVKPLEEKLAALDEEEEALRARLKEIGDERAAVKAKHDRIAQVMVKLT